MVEPSVFLVTADQVINCFVLAPFPLVECTTPVTWAGVLQAGSVVTVSVEAVPVLSSVKVTVSDRFVFSVATWFPEPVEPCEVICMGAIVPEGM